MFWRPTVSVSWFSVNHLTQNHWSLAGHLSLKESENNSGCLMTAIVYRLERSKIFVFQANQLIILKKHFWNRSNHLLSRGGRPLSKSDKRNNGGARSDEGHKIHNSLDDFQVFLLILAAREFLSLLSSVFASSLCFYTYSLNLPCVYVCNSL